MLPVRCRQAIADLRRQFDGLIQRDRLATGEHVEQRFTFDEFHHNQRAPGILDVVKDVHDVRMLDRGRRARLALQSLDGDLVHALGKQHLDRHGPLQPLVTRQPDLSVGACAKQSAETESTRDELEFCAGHVREVP